MHAERQQIPADGESVEHEAHRTLIGLQSDLIYRHGTGGGPLKYKEYVDNVIAALLRWHEGGRVTEREAHQSGRTHRKTALVEMPTVDPEPDGTPERVGVRAWRDHLVEVAERWGADELNIGQLEAKLTTALRACFDNGVQQEQRKRPVVNVMADSPKIDLRGSAERLLGQIIRPSERVEGDASWRKVKVLEALQEAYDAGKGVRMEHTDDVGCTLTEEALVDLTMERLHNIFSWTVDGGTKIRAVVAEMVKRSKECADA